MYVTLDQSGMVQPSPMDQSASAEESSVPNSRLGITHNQMLSWGAHMKIHLDLIKYLLMSLTLLLTDICICGFSFLFSCCFGVFWWCSSNVLIKNSHFIHISQSLSIIFILTTYRYLQYCCTTIVTHNGWSGFRDHRMLIKPKSFFDYCRAFVLKNYSLSINVFLKHFKLLFKNCVSSNLGTGHEN